MATWYVDPTATYNGDGTLSTGASANGQPGAWNALVAVLTNNTTYPLANGDIVFVRSADASGNDITVNVTSTFTQATRGSDALPIFWVLDNGTVWTYAGRLTMNISNNVVVTFAQHNWFKSFNRRWRWLHNQGASTLNGFVFSYSEYESQVYETANSYQQSFTMSCTNTSRRNIRWLDCLFDLAQFYSANNTMLSLPSSNPSMIELINCDFDITGAPVAIAALLNLSSYGQRLRILGGRVIGSTENTALLNFSSYSSGVCDCRVDGFDMGLLKPIVFTATLTDSISNIEFIFTCLSNNKYRMQHRTPVGYVEWVPDENYPVLNAMLPDADSTPWSLKALPSTSLAGLQYPMILSKMTKFFDLSAGVKTITIELLICNTYPTMRKRDWWAIIHYVDNATGLPKMINTFSLTGDLDTSSADWSTTVYGAKTYVKRKIEITTPTAIKQYTDITVDVRSSILAPSVTDFYFVDPEFTVI